MTTAAIDIRSKQATEPKDIDEVLLILQSENLVLTKDKKGQVGNQKTKYADLVQANDVVVARLNQLATIWSCLPHYEAGEFGLRYQLKHVPSGTEKTGTWPLAVGPPQQMGSATTYGRRYALLAVTGVVSEEEDDDGAAASGRTRRQAAAPNSPPKNSEGPTTAPTTVTMRRRTTSPSSDDKVTDKQLGALHAAFNAAGITDRAARLIKCEEILDIQISSSKDLTKQQASRILDDLKPEEKHHE